MIYCGAPSPAICQGILIPAVSKTWPSSFSPFNLIFVEGHGDLQCCPKGETPARGRWPLASTGAWGCRERGGDPAQHPELCEAVPVSEPARSSTAFPFPLVKVNRSDGIHCHIPLIGNLMGG